MSTKEYVASYEDSEICALCYHDDSFVLVEDSDNIEINLCQMCEQGFRSHLQSNIDSKINENESDKTLRDLVVDTCTRLLFKNEYRVTELTELRKLLNDALGVAENTTLSNRLRAEITEDIEHMRARCLVAVANANQS